MYRLAATTAAPASARSAIASIEEGSSDPSAIVTTTYGALVASMPERIAASAP
jgi:hypothetical protein